MERAEVPDLKARGLEQVQILLIDEAEGLVFLSPYLSRTVRSGVCRLEDARCEIGTTCQAWQGGSFQQGSVKANKLF